MKIAIGIGIGIAIAMAIAVLLPGTVYAAGPAKHGQIAQPA
ncbi:hypothetical protein [Cupriavidus basilensis]|nr:hypothetical protein [Cupriavidus basilensis]